MIKPRIFLVTLAAIILAGLVVWLVPDDERELAEKARALALVEQLRSQRALAERGEAKAQFFLGESYRTGSGVAVDPLEARRWYLRAADQGFAKAQYRLGRFYEQGLGVNQDFQRAAEWYGLAAEIGDDADAQFALGQLYFFGRGLAQSYPVAVEWFAKAAQKGHGAAQYLMGSVYIEGWAMKPDRLEAYKWYTLALPKAGEIKALNPRYDPVAARARLAKKMSRNQIERAERLAASWRAAKPKTRPGLLKKGGWIALSKRKPSRAAHPRAEPASPPPEKVYIRVAPFDVAVPGGRYRPAAVTLEAVDRAAGDLLCAFEPRVRDALAQVLSLLKLDVKEGRYGLKEAAAPLAGAVNAAMGSAAAAAAVLALGERREGKIFFQSAVTSVPDCRALMEK